MDEKILHGEITGNGPIQKDIAIKVMKSICKIKVINKEANRYGTGFFVKLSGFLKCLITNYHVLNPNFIDSKIELEIWNKKKILLNLKEQHIKYYKRPIDITIIEINNLMDIFKDILFLDYDNNYKQKEYIIYDDVDIFSIHHPLGKDAVCAIGKIINLNGYEFDHTILTEPGSSGSPIILINNDINFLPVIGIHKLKHIESDINRGTFIGEILNEILNDFKKNNNNFIIAEIYIKDADVNKDIQIINSESYILNNGNYRIDLEDENGIKDCEIKINNKLIKSNYYHKFNKKGKYIIKYSFYKEIIKIGSLFRKCSSLTYIDFSNFNAKNVLNMSNMFDGCSSLININLSNFNTQNATNMGSMFSECSSLTKIDLSNFNTKNVTYMDHMFFYCSSLKQLDLSKFNIENVIDISSMFTGCKSLTDIDLSNFNTKNCSGSLDVSHLFFNCSSLVSINLSNFNTRNVHNMKGMFSGCSSLRGINLSNFNTQSVINMSYMFSGCSSLKELDLSNFNTQNVVDMSYMFGECSSLTNIDLSNFNTQKVSSMNSMFSGCSSLKYLNLSNFHAKSIVDKRDIFFGCFSLKKENLISKDNKISDELNKIPQKIDICLIF